MTIGRTWKLWAHRYEGGKLWHVGARKWVQLHGLDCPLVPVLVEEVLGDRYAADVTHYGWQYAEGSRYRHGDAPTMIQIRAGKDPKRAMMLLALCVGIETATDGNVVALRITERAAAIEAPELTEECARLRSDNQRLAQEVSRLQTEVDRLNARLAPKPPAPDLDDTATRFSLLELDL